MSERILRGRILRRRGGRRQGVFREARARLSYEHFSEFLQNIKELNAHKQPPAEPVARADDIFGESNKDLFRTFETLLVKHLPK